MGEFWRAGVGGRGAGVWLGLAEIKWFCVDRQPAGIDAKLSVLSSQGERMGRDLFGWLGLRRAAAMPQDGMRFQANSDLAWGMPAASPSHPACGLLL